MEKQTEKERSSGFFRYLKTVSIVTGLVAAFLLLFIAFLPDRLFSGSGQNSQPSPAAPEQVTVAITDDGFQPDSISIPFGSTVTWVNQGSRQHWPASDPHPLHNGYPTTGGCIGSTLDACRGLNPGEKFSFTFTYIGTWGMHDHLFPGNTMSVTVEGRDSASAAPSVSLAGRIGIIIHLAAGHLRFFKPRAGGQAINAPSVEQFRLMNFQQQQVTIEQMAANDPAQAWQYLKQAYLVNGQQLPGDAHGLAHKVGNAAYEKYGIDGVRICDETFAFGCFHGVTEKMLLEQGKGAVTEVEQKCVALFTDPATHYLITGCIHGMGHGLFGWEGGQVAPALADCDQLDSKWRTYCYDGVFMENSDSIIPSAFNVSDPWGFCMQLKTQYQYNCARYQAEVFSEVVGHNYAKIEQLCDKTSVDPLRAACLQNDGYQIAQAAAGDAAKVTQLCGTLTEQDDKYTCISAAATETSFQQFQNWQATSAVLCKSLPESLRQPCQALSTESPNQALNLNL